MSHRTDEWRVAETRIHRPNVLPAAVICAVFIAAAGVLWAVLAGGAARGAPGLAGVLLRNGLPALCVGFGLVALAAVVRDAIRRGRPLRSAAEDVLPEVPTHPVNDTALIAHDHVRHQIERTETGWSLVPRHRSIHRTGLYLTAWIALTVAGINGLLWSFAPDDRQTEKIAMSAVTLVAGCGVTAIVWFATRDSQNRARRMDVDSRRRTIQFDGARLVSLDNVAAVQICPLRIKIPPTPVAGGRWGYDGDALEVNAVLRDSASAIDRETLYIVRADFPGAAALAAQVAERLGVPLLNHATAEYWPAEIERARDRPWTFHGAAP